MEVSQVVLKASNMEATEVRYFDKESSCLMYIFQSDFLPVTELTEQVEARVDEESSKKDEMQQRFTIIE